MSIRLECYFRDQVIRGELDPGTGRPLDLLNNSLEPFIVLHNASVLNLDERAEQLGLGLVFVQKDQLLLAISQEEPSTVAAQFRGGWVEKIRVPIRAGLGPLILTGDFHVTQWEHCSVEIVFRNAEGRAFLPLTNARLSWPTRPEWSAEATTAFIRRSAISYTSVVTEAEADREPSEADSAQQLIQRLSAHFGPPAPKRNAR